MKLQLVFFIMVACFCIACSDNGELQKSIFVKDSDNPGLPEYSELGYNTFGAYYDRQAFISSSTVPIKVIVTNGETALTFTGRKDFYDEMSIRITMNDFLPDDYSGLLSLEGKVIDLTGSPYTVFVRDRTGEYKASVFNGEFTIKRAQYVFVDKEPAEVILSGTFEFQALVNGGPITMSKGRFDVGVSKDNFFKY